jgi:regulator of protease activity HflC (stomatin/prohibitin superfamily)
MRLFRYIGKGVKKVGVLVKATLLGSVLGIIELVGNPRGRRVLGVLMLGGLTAAIILAKPIQSIPPGDAAVRVNKLTGGVSIMREGWAFVFPGVQELRIYELHDQVYHPADAAKLTGAGAFQSSEGLTIGIDVSVRWALDPTKMAETTRLRPEQLEGELVQPAVDAVLHTVFAQHSVREIYAGKRVDIQHDIEETLRTQLGPEGIVVKTVAIGAVDLPREYRAGLEAVLTEELAAEKMTYTLEMKEKGIKQSELEAEADKVRREKAAEAAGQEQIIAAKAQAEAMQHVLPLKEKEIEQKRLEAEAGKVVRLKEAEANAEARRIEAGGEADSRRTLADSDAYRLDVTGKATTAQMAREGELLQKNPLLIQKALADKLSDKIQVIIAPPNSGGFIAGGLIGQGQNQPAEPSARHQEE